MMLVNSIRMLYVNQCLLDPPHTRWKFNADLKIIKPRSNKAPSSENMVMAFFQSSRPEVKVERFCTTGTQR